MAKYHPNKDVDAAIDYAVSQGWRFVEKGNSHTVAYLYCTHESSGQHDSMKCHISIYGSPKNPGNHAKKIRKAVDGRAC